MANLGIGGSSGYWHIIEEPGFIGSLSGFKNLKLLASIRREISDEIIRNTLIRVGQLFSLNDAHKWEIFSDLCVRRMYISFPAILGNSKLFTSTRAGVQKPCTT